jgi:hypothetical protein
MLSITDLNNFNRLLDDLTLHTTVRSMGWPLLAKPTQGYAWLHIARTKTRKPENAKKQSNADSLHKQYIHGRLSAEVIANPSLLPSNPDLGASQGR